MSTFTAATPEDSPELVSSSPDARYERALYYTSLSTLVAAPVLLLVPPRKLDLYTFSLFGAIVVAANHQTKARTGNGILLWLGRKEAALAQNGDRRRESITTGSQKQIEPRVFPAAYHPARLDREFWAQHRTTRGKWDVWADQSGALLGTDGLARMRSEFRGAQASVRDESSVKTARIDQVPETGLDTSDEGPGIGDTIIEQIWQVWNWGRDGEDQRPSAGST